MESKIRDENYTPFGIEEEPTWDPHFWWIGEVGVDFLDNRNKAMVEVGEGGRQVRIGDSECR